VSVMATFSPRMLAFDDESSLSAEAPPAVASTNKADHD
jgi:hypothetical protein